MKLKPTLLLLVLGLIISSCFYLYTINDEDDILVFKIESIKEKKEKKSTEQRRRFAIERAMFEFNLQKSPLTGKIPEDEKQRELVVARQAVVLKNIGAARVSGNVYTSRGPSNFGGRTRAMAFDQSDNTNQTIFAGGVSSGLFRSTNGGGNWVKVSSNSDIHNVTALAQDPRPGFQNIWYYGTGERVGNSASLGGTYGGNGIWRSVNSGNTWTQIPETGSNFESFDSFFDVINALAVSPITGDLFVGTFDRIYRYDGADFTIEIAGDSGGVGMTDVLVNDDGRVYAALDGTDSANGVYTSPTGDGSWTRIAQNGIPAGWNAANGSNGRIVLASAPSNQNIIYALYTNGGSSDLLELEADLWRYDNSTGIWTDFSSRLPDEPGDDSPGNDPFSVQFGYDLVVSVKPDNENFVLVGGTNIYRINDINTDLQFVRIGGYNSNQNYALYDTPGGDTHHPDIHSLVFDPSNFNVFYTGTDGGIHRTDDVTAATVDWVNLNNNYITYQYYHVALDHFSNNDLVGGGTQDNGTTLGGIDFGLLDNTTMITFSGGDGAATAMTTNRGGPSDIQIYASTQRGNMFTNFPAFRNITPNGDNSIFVTYFHLDPDNSQNLYYASFSEIFRTTDAENVITETWENMGQIPSSQNIRSFATTRGVYSPATSYLLFGDEGGNIYRLDDPMTNVIANTVDITPPTATANAIVSGLAIHPTNPDIVMAVYSNYNSNNIYITNNATDASPIWINVERNLTNHSIRSAAIVEVDGETGYYVGTARGLYSSPDPNAVDWEIEGQNQMGLAVISGLVYRPSDNKLLIGTHGNGMFETIATNTLSDDDKVLSAAINLYPNPTETDLNIQISNNIAIQKYEIFDQTGKIVSKNNTKGISNSVRIDVSYMSTGLYFIKIYAEGKTSTKRFIKQ